MTRRRVLTVLGAALVASVLAGTATADARTTPTTAPTPTTTRPAKPCTDATASLRPDGPVPAPNQMPAGTSLRTIADSKRLVVGVDENTLYFSARDPESGDILGFEDALAREIANAIFGDPNAVKLVTVTTPEKISAVQSGKVDMTISVVTMSCSRWQDVDFSTAYYDAFQQLLVRGDSPIRRQADLPGKRVCVTTGSSSEKFVTENLPSAKAVPVETRTNCLVKLQESQVDAVLLPSSILAGLQAQDPTTVLLPERLVDKTGAPATNTYGIAISDAHPELTRYVNGLLERWREDGTLRRLQERNLPPVLQRATPPARYKD